MTRYLRHHLPDWADTPDEADAWAEAVDDWHDERADQRREVDVDGWWPR